MPEPTQEPDNYTIGEMMERLKSQSSSTGDEGKLVTRADGSQAVKMKKRKRRTNSKRDKIAEQNHRFQLIQIAGFVIFLVLLLLIGGIGIVYANSPMFRKSLISKATDITGAEVEVNQFRMNPVNAKALKVTMQWPEWHVLDFFQGSDATADISPVSFTGKKFQGAQLVASKGFLSLKAPGERSATEAVEEMPEIAFGRYSIPQFDLYFGAARNGKMMLSKTEVSIYPTSIQGRGEIRFNGGHLKISGWPELELDRAYINFRDKELHVKSMRFQVPQKSMKNSVDDGSIDLTGTIHPLELDATHSLNVTMDSFHFSYLLGQDLGELFEGDVMTIPEQGSNLLKFTPKAVDEMATLDLQVTNALDSQIELSGFKFLGSLALMLEDKWFEKPVFESPVSARIRRIGNKVEMTEISFEKRGRMALRGSLISQGGGKISGSLRVGIPDVILGISKNQRTHEMFSPVQGEYRWVDLEIGGTGAMPQDNFKQLFQAAPANEESGASERGLEENAVDTFESLINGR